MNTRRVLAVALLGLLACGVEAAEYVKVGGSKTRYPTSVETQVNGKHVRFALTGAVLRTKYGFSVYSIASYVQEGLKIPDASTLANVSAAKILHLVFEREVDGRTMAKSFRESIAMNNPAPAFAAELTKLENYFVANPAKQGGHLWLTYVPGRGLGCQIDNHPGMVIESVPFAQAIWSVYLGPKNLGVAIRSGLSSRL